MNPIQALILDYGQVLVRDQSAAVVKRMADLASLSTDEFHRRYWRHRPDYDSGRASATEYWQLVLRDGSTHVGPSEAKVIEALTQADVESWLDYREEVWDIAAEFKERRGRTAFLSNGVPEVMNRLRAERNLSKWFDSVIVSYEVGCTKPDPRIYQACLSALDVPAASALFVDDRRANLDGAQELGIQVFHFTDDSSVAGLKSLLAHNG